MGLMHSFLFNLASNFTRIMLAINESDGATGAGTTPDGNAAIDPIYDALTKFGPPLMILLATVMALYGAIMGFSYSKAENADERDKAKKKLVYGLIGFGVIIVLVALLYMLRGPITDYTNTETAELGME